LARVFDGMGINSLLFAPPAEPMRTILDYLVAQADEAICPSDCETRTFLHDLPVVREFSAPALLAALRRRKCAIVPGYGVVTFGAVSPEQTFVVFSSVCFAVTVKFLADYLQAVKADAVTPTQQRVFDAVAPRLQAPRAFDAPLMTGPFADTAEVVAAMDEVGKRTVALELVDSFFGNVSYCCDDVLYISQTGSSLDELPGCIDPCPLDGSSCAGITASSELTAHREIYLGTGHRAILHGHPRFSVVLSMDCERTDCEYHGECFRRCPHPREVCGVPVVPGEVGTGPYGLCHTVPPAIQGQRGVVVYGHGVFTTGAADFNPALEALVDIETACRDEYFRRVHEG
jgi:ribulose-5-phosphate 4-epimerase/fuculose-1-phosphate aldolase